MEVAAMINFRLVRHLWLFLAVAEERNFGRAAARLGMSQPPLTQQIQVLEQSLKVKLFDRSRRGAQLTPAGAAILPAVQKVAEQLQRLEAAVREAVAGQSGMLTIGAITTAIADPLPQVIARFRERRPDITVSVAEIDSAEAVAALEAGDIDVAFARLEGDLGSAVRSVPVLQDHLAVALPAGHALCSTRNVSLQDLTEEPFVMFPRKVSPVYFDSLVSACRGAGFSPRVLYEARSVSAQLAFVGCGQGIALVPSSAGKLAGENVVIRPVRDEVRVVTTAVAWNAKKANPLVDLLKSAALEVIVAPAKRVRAAAAPRRRKAENKPAATR